MLPKGLVDKNDGEEKLMSKESDEYNNNYWRLMLGLIGLLHLLEFLLFVFVFKMETANFYIK